MIAEPKQASESNARGYTKGGTADRDGLGGHGRTRTAAVYSLGGDKECCCKVGGGGLSSEYVWVCSSE
jgi:hypothetical protein